MFAFPIRDSSSQFMRKAPHCWQLRLWRWSMMGNEPWGSKQAHLSTVLNITFGLNSLHANYSTSLTNLNDYLK
jgi:hypothetical protein